MPLALAIMGVLLLVVGVKGTYGDLAKLLKEDFTGSGNFFVWLLAVGVVGSIGYVPALQQFSRIFLGLVLVTFLIKSVGFPDMLIKALQSVSGDSGGAASGATGSSPGASIPSTGGS